MKAENYTASLLGYYVAYKKMGALTLQVEHIVSLVNDVFYLAVLGDGKYRLRRYFELYKDLEQEHCFIFRLKQEMEEFVKNRDSLGRIVELAETKK